MGSKKYHTKHPERGASAYGGKGRRPPMETLEVLRRRQIGNPLYPQPKETSSDTDKGSDSAESN